MQGHTDISLEEEGHRQAACIGNRLRGCQEPPQAVFSSDLSRALQTAEAIAGPLGLTVQVDPRLRETCLGDWEGLTRDEIHERGEAELLARYQRDPHIHRPPNSETLEQVWERMHLALDTIRERHPSGEVAVVGHGGSLRALICGALDAPLPSMRRFFLENASLSIVDEVGTVGNRYQRLVLLNDTSHLNVLNVLNV